MKEKIKCVISMILKCGVKDGLTLYKDLKEYRNKTAKSMVRKICVGGGINKLPCSYIRYFLDNQYIDKFARGFSKTRI